jgi:aryl-alcohol dehydrogenase-like predicted oxidoreductase
VKYRRLGRTGLWVSEISLGNWLTQGRTLDQGQTDELVKTAFDLGINLFDTADVYNNGKAEEALGSALKSLGIARKDIVLATKCYFPFSDRPNDKGLSRKHIFESVHDSLARLQTSYLDVMQCHRWDEETPLAETLAAFGDLVRQGKILYWGVSEWSGDQIRRACAIADEMGSARPISNQPRCHIYERYIEAEVVPASEELGLGQIIFSPLAQGLLTGKYKPGHEFPAGTRAADPSSNQFILRLITPERLEQVQVMEGWAQELGITMGQLALRWCLRLPNISSCIIGASRPEQISENAAASGDSLPEDVIERIDALTKGS